MRPRLSATGNGVYGGSSSGNGVEGNADGPDVSGVYGQATNLYGFGVFNANAVFQFQQYTGYDRQGWSTRRLGYLSEEQFGYALARFAVERGEGKPAWARYLGTNVGSYWKRSMGWLGAEGGN